MPRPLPSPESAFTLLELLVVVAINGILASIGIAQYGDFKKRAKISRTASEMRGFVAGFIAYSIDFERLPPDSHRELPTGMTDYIDQSLWDKETPIGGYYNWEGPDSYGYGGISLFDCPAPNEDLKILDRMLDDGNLAVGRVRMESNGRATFIFEEE